MAMDMYEIRKVGSHGKTSEPLVVDECNLLSIIRMTKTRNRTLHKRLVKWFKEVNGEFLKTGRDGKLEVYSVASILEGIEEIGKM